MPGLEDLAWFGTGPHETYPDRKRSGVVAVHRSTVTDQAVAYVRAGAAALGALPTVGTVVAERFFDEGGGMQLVLHSPFGARINRAWGLALRKRFCRSFNFELQAAATDNGIVISLSDQHSFPLELVFKFLSKETVEDVLTQAMLPAPMFEVRHEPLPDRPTPLETIRDPFEDLPEGRPRATRAPRLGREDAGAQRAPDLLVREPVDAPAKPASRTLASKMIALEQADMLAGRVVDRAPAYQRYAAPPESPVSSDPFRVLPGR